MKNRTQLKFGSTALGVLAALTLMASPVRAAVTVLVDFGGLAPGNPVGGNYFNQWNPGNNLDLLLTDGTTDSGWNMDSTTAAVVNNGTSPDYTTTFVGAPDPFNDDTVSSDALNLENGDTARNIRITGLDTDQRYDVVIYGARASTQTRITDYSVIGLTTVNGSIQTSGTGSGIGTNYNNNTVFTVREILPDVTGNIVITYVANTGDFGYLNALQFSESVPEPSTLALLGLGIAGCGWMRRRKNSLR